MVDKRSNASDSKKPRRPPATTPEAREMQLVSYAFDLAEKQLLDGTVSAQVLSKLLSFGTPERELQLEKLRKENLLAEARVQQISASTQNSALYEEAIRAMKTYAGDDIEPDHDE